MRALEDLDQRLARQNGVLVRVHATEGSAPRPAGAWMVVWTDTITGSIGGGQLEHDATGRARDVLRGAMAITPPQRYALGPSLGQCCGGVVWLEFRAIGAGDGAALRAELAPSLTPVALFGGGHVGAALARILADLPFQLRWIDSRDGVFPSTPAANVTVEHSEPVQGAVPSLVPGSRVLIMSFSHAEDLDIVIACLVRVRQKDDLPFIGLIGSKTKWATFRRRLQARGFTQEEMARVTCPIGIPGIEGKEPEVIAVAVAAQLLQS